MMFFSFFNNGPGHMTTMNAQEAKPKDKPKTKKCTVTNSDPPHNLDSLPWPPLPPAPSPVSPPERAVCTSSQANSARGVRPAA